ncbi:MAG: hypothetical protein PWP70_1733 [Moorella sp. (in: firmicutes)]|nr:hypothetical protein [Moorella sp. (in: firmicutes)]
MGRVKIYENPVNNYREKVKEGFNWWVLLFGPLWYLFNGMVGQGIGWFMVAVFAGYFTLGIGTVIVWIIAGAKANADKEKKYLQKGWKFVGYEDEINS